jgi:hypothetical protein
MGDIEAAHVVVEKTPKTPRQEQTAGDTRAGSRDSKDLLPDAVGNGGMRAEPGRRVTRVGGLQP